MTLTDAGSSNGTLLDGRPVTTTVNWPGGAVVRAGETLLTLGTRPAPDIVLVPAPDGGLAVNRPPRLLPAPTAVLVPWPDPPGERSRAGFPLIAILAPLAMGVLMAVLFKRPEYLLFVGTTGACPRTSGSRPLPWWWRFSRPMTRPGYFGMMLY